MFSERRHIIVGIFMLTGLIFIVRLFFLQVTDSSYKLLADNNATERIIEYPYRGLIYDRNGKLLVHNEPVFDILVVMKQLVITDTMEFCKDFDITKQKFKDIIYEIRRDRGYNKNKPMPFLKQLSTHDYARFENLLTKYKGLYIQSRTVRGYKHQSAANLLGYIGEISKKQLENQKKNYYQQGDYIGISGLEYSYEEYLRGQRGVKYVMKDVNGVRKGSFREGKFDTTSVPGQNLICTIDLDLQQYGEKLMQNKIGSVVAIEPSTGEILAFISTPSYDPNLLAGRRFSENFSKLEKDPLKPLFNRPLQAMYPPGSIFKVAQALTGLQEGVLTQHTTFSCDKSLVNCHPHPSPQDLAGSLQWSCNPWYFMAFKRMINRNQSPNKYIDTEMGYDAWRKHIISFGFGQKLDIDLPNMKGGYVPTNSFFDKVHGDLRWKHSSIRSLDIGQGELLIVPIQMANLAATVANKGFFYTPHLIKSIGNSNKPLPKYLQKNFTTVDSSYFKYVIKGMEQAVTGGTAYWVRHPKIAMCGKTGTVQNPHGDDHSVFIVFAPKEDPKIAMAVFVENAGFGAMTAAPIATLMIEKYLTDTITMKYHEDYILKKNLIPKNYDQK